MRKILVVADPLANEQMAFSKAQRLAKLTSSDIHIVLFAYNSLTLTDEQDECDLKEIQLQHCEHWWDTYLQKHSPEVTISYEAVWEKHIGQWLLEHCKQHEYQMIVKTGHRSEAPFHTPTDWLLFRESPIPVYSANANMHTDAPVVLVALDIMTRNEDKRRLNDKLLEQAFRLAVRTNAQIHACFAIKIPDLVKDFGLIDVPKYTQKVTHEAHDRCQQWLETYDINPQHLYMDVGSPWEVITQFAYQQKVQCIVIGSMSRKGAAGMLLGNTAEKVIQYAQTDLLVVNRY